MRQINSEAGFTFIEVMIALLIFAVGIMAVYGMQLQSIQMNNYARRLTEASSTAREMMERLKGLDYDDPVLADDDGNGKAGLDVATAGKTDGEEGNIFWNIAVNTPAIDTKTVHVIATWNWRGEVKRVTYRTILVKED